MDDTQRILDAIRRLVRMLRVSDRAAQSRAGLSAAQLFVLHELGKTPAMSLGEVAERTRTDQSSVSVVVTRLVKAGLVERTRDPRDGRRLVLRLSRRGQRILERAPAVAQQQLIGVIDQFPPAKRRHFAELFSAFLDALDGGTKTPPMLFEDPPRAKRKSRRS